MPHAPPLALAGRSPRARPDTPAGGGAGGGRCWFRGQLQLIRTPRDEKRPSRPSFRPEGASGTILPDARPSFQRNCYFPRNCAGPRPDVDAGAEPGPAPGRRPRPRAAAGRQVAELVRSIGLQARRPATGLPGGPSDRCQTEVTCSAYSSSNNAFGATVVSSLASHRRGVPRLPSAIGCCPAQCPGVSRPGH